MHKDSVHAGQAAYTPFTLALYDKAVLGLSCRWLWRCPAPRLLEHYQAHISDNHLDVGSGYFLDNVRFPSEAPRIALMDLNADSLTFCERRVSRYQPEVLQRNVLAPIDYRGARFDFLAINLPLLKPVARVFGATLLQGDVPRSLPAKGLMSLYNAKAIFPTATTILRPCVKGRARDWMRFSGVLTVVQRCFRGVCPRKFLQ